LGYELYQVGSLLKSAFAYAKKEMGRDYYRKGENNQYERARMVSYGSNNGKVKAGEDMGHDLAMVTASKLTEDDIARMFYMPSSVIRANDEYDWFFVRAQIYLMYRGIPISATHQTETESYYYYLRGHNVIRTNGPGSGVEIRTRKLHIGEAALRNAGIPLYEPKNQRRVDDRYGHVWAPKAGKIKNSYVTGVHSTGPITPGNTLFLMEIWDTPSISRGLYVYAEVGGEIGRVFVKEGQIVQIGDPLMHIGKPWVDSPLALPNGGKGAS
jgi:hypothetical protein